MAARKKKGKTLTDNQISKMVRESAHQIWLAGLGAYAKAEEEGSKMFETLAGVGATLEKRTRKTVGGSIKAAEATVAGVRDTASDTWDRLEDIFEQRVARALHAMNIPTGDEIADLAERVEELRKTVSKSGPAKAASKKKTAKRKTSRKKTARKKTAKKKATKKKKSAKKKTKATRKKSTRKKSSARKTSRKRKKTTRKKRA